jgi:hypothetical protein
LEYLIVEKGLLLIVGILEGLRTELSLASFALISWNWLVIVLGLVVAFLDVPAIDWILIVLAIFVGAKIMIQVFVAVFRHKASQLQETYRSISKNRMMRMGECSEVNILSLKSFETAAFRATALMLFGNR